jgi:hypothetical protein
MREALFYSKTYWIPPRGSVGGLSEKIVRFFHHRMNVSCQSIDATCTSANALGRFANAGSLARNHPKSFKASDGRGRRRCAKI